VLVALAKVRDCANELKFRVFFLPALVQANTNCTVATSNGEIWQKHYVDEYTASFKKITGKIYLIATGTA